MNIWILAALVMGGALIAFEATRPQRRRVALRVGVALISAVALVGLVVLAGPQDPAAERLTIVTPGAAEPTRPRGLIRIGEPGDPRSLATLGAAGDELRRARSLTVLGWGFLPDELPAFELPRIVHRAPALPAGITALAAPAIVALGRRFVVRGTAEFPGGDSAWIVLEDPGGPRDSAVARRTDARFTLSDHPRSAGAVDYRVRIRGASPATTDTLGVWVTSRPPPSVLILEGSPSFETGFLKRWLAGQGGAVGIRTTVSRDRYRTEAINGAKRPAALDDRLLKAYDLVIVDGAALSAFRSAERDALKRALRAGGGLLIAGAADRYLAGPRNERLCEFTTVARGAGEPRLVRPAWADAPRPGRTAIRAVPAALAGKVGIPLVRDGQGDILAAVSHIGDGAVAVTMLESPSRWVLEGDDELFAGYWATLIGAAARDTVARVRIAGSVPIVPDRRLTLERRARAPGRPLIVFAPSGAADTVALAQDPFDPARWSGRYWPRETGWHRVAGTDAGFKVQRAGAWPGVEAATRLATMARLSATRSTAPAGPPSSLLRLMCWAALLAALTVLWAEDRWRRDGG